MLVVIAWDAVCYCCERMLSVLPSRRAKGVASPKEKKEPIEGAGDDRAEKERAECEEGAEKEAS